MKAILLSILCIAALIGCGDSSSSSNTPVLTSEYYPLEVGNKWRYIVSSNIIDTVDIYNLTVESTELLNGKTYYKIANASEMNKRAVLYSYVRVENEKVYTFANNMETLAIDLVNIDTTVGYVYGTTNSLETRIGTFNTVKLVKRNDIDTKNTPYESYAPAIGLVFKADNTTASEIIYAKIGDKIYQ